MPMWGLITIFMEFVGQAYVRHAGGSVGRSTIINTRQRMYYTMLSPKFSYNLKYNFIVLPCLGTILVYIIIIRLLAVLSTILPQSWPDPPYLHYTLSKLSHGFAPPWMLIILRLLLRVKPKFWWWWLQMMIKMHRPWPPGVSAVTEWGVCQDLHPHTNFLPDGNEISFFCL